MTERAYGYLYDGSRDIKDDAANIRRHIKTMTKSGVLPADWKYRVRIDRYSGGQSIDVYGESPRPIYAADPQADGWVRHAETGEHVLRWRDKYTLAAGAVHDALTDLLNGHNHDGSDIQSDYFDVKFYGSVHVKTVAGIPQFDGNTSAEERS